MKKLVMLSLLSSTSLLISACSDDSGSQPTAAQLQACAQAANCNPALAAKGAGINPGILTNAQIPAGTGNISVASSDGTSSLTNTNAGGSIVTLNKNAGFDASKILDAKNGINYENAVSTLNNAIATGNKNPAAASQAYESSNEGAAGAK